PGWSGARSRWSASRSRATRSIIRTTRALGNSVGSPSRNPSCPATTRGSNGGAGTPRWRRRGRIAPICWTNSAADLVRAGAIIRSPSQTHAMNTIDLVEKPRLRDDLPEFRPGDTVKVHVRVVEGNRERIQVFQGVVIRRQGGGL